MRALALSTSSTDMSLQDSPFSQDCSCVVTGANSVTVSGSNDDSNWTVLATLTTAEPFQNLSIGGYQYLKSSAVATLLGN